MAQYFCKNCGALNTVTDKQATVICKLCGTKQSIRNQVNTATVAATVKSSDIIKKYQEAQALSVEGKILEAAVAFQSFTYKDSKVKAKKFYDELMAKVEELKENHQYEEAFKIIDTLSTAFSMNAIKEKFLTEWHEYVYVEADKFSKENKFEEACKNYESIKDYKDSAKLLEMNKDFAEKYKVYAPNIQIIQKTSTVDGYDEEKFNAAISELNSILGFKDTNVLVNKYTAEFKNTKFIKDLEKEAKEKRQSQHQMEVNENKIEVEKKSHAGLIIGIIAGVVVVVSACFAAWYFLLRK